ncbi:MAG: hypothetical protein ABSH48_24105 [Verrucomicrobiota bacterium]|jgi:hypothetical protein
MKQQSFPLTVTEKGVSAVIRQSEKIKGGKTHHYFIVEYFMLGKRKQVWRSGLDDAKAVASDGCHFEEKMDGEFSMRDIGPASIVGEAMPGGQFIAFDVARAYGEDLRGRQSRKPNTRWR